MSVDIETPLTHKSPRWQPLDAIERRILGVLVEKAKTTPENYPLSLNALKSGCNQKNNRSPLMQLEETAVEEALEKLRKAGAVVQVQGTSRVDRFRHLAYDWLGVEKVELAVMAELLLRGAQTVGELRGRAARMEPIKDLADLRPTLDSLEKKRLIQYLTPPGRGCVVTHTLYLDREMDKVRREADAMHAAAAGSETPEVSRSSTAAPQRSSPPAPLQHADRDNRSDQINALREELHTLKHELAAARADFESSTEQLRTDLDDLKRQLGN
jgi:uncharacterized protein YceH (UPF0502 family)